MEHDENCSTSCFTRTLAVYFKKYNVTCTCKQTSTSTLALRHTCSNAEPLYYEPYEVDMHLVNY